jgi:hypothetical protein
VKFEIYSHRNAEGFVKTNIDLFLLWEELTQVIDSITDDEIAEVFLNANRKAKSISEAINKIIDQKLVAKKWSRQSPIFKDPVYQERGRGKANWRLDFAKDKIAVEVAFNHGNDVAWNLIKPVLSSELNHVDKAIQTSLGVLVTANQDLKMNGGFDPAVGTFEKYVEYLKPLNSILVSPMFIIGLKAPDSFVIQTEFIDGKKRGVLVKKRL